MPLRSLPFREVKRRLEAAGFVEQSQQGSRMKFVLQTTSGTPTAIVPRHREVAAGTQRSILRQAGISEEGWGTL